MLSMHLLPKWETAGNHKGVDSMLILKTETYLFWNILHYILSHNTLAFIHWPFNVYIHGIKTCNTISIHGLGSLETIVNPLNPSAWCLLISPSFIPRKRGKVIKSDPALKGSRFCSVIFYDTIFLIALNLIKWGILAEIAWQCLV